jgi:hypothetical protein
MTLIVLWGPLQSWDNLFKPGFQTAIFSIGPIFLWLTFAYFVGLILGQLCQMLKKVNVFVENEKEYLKECVEKFYPSHPIYYKNGILLSAEDFPPIYVMHDYLRIVSSQDAVRILKLRSEERLCQVVVVGFAVLALVNPFSMTSIFHSERLFLEIFILFSIVSCWYRAKRTGEHYIDGTCISWIYHQLREGNLFYANSNQEYNFYRKGNKTVKNNISFLIRSKLELSIQEYKSAFLSLPFLEHGDGKFSTKDLLVKGEVSTEGKYTIDEHLASLSKRHDMLLNFPLLVIGLRNTLVNPRSILIKNGKAFGPDKEKPTESKRPYYGIGLKGGRFTIDCALGSNHKQEEWSEFFCSGIPVLWDDISGEDLLDLIMCEASDHSHVFDIPRGNNPLATDDSRAAWKKLQDVFLENITSPLEVAAKAMRDIKEELPISINRCETYLHSVLGIDGQGNLINVIANGKLEDIGQLAAKLGCRRAVCVENSGSITPTFYHNGYPGLGIPLLRGPNFRPKGRALLVIELANDAFATL